MIKRVVAVLAVVLLLLIGGSVWAYHWYRNQLKKFKEIQAKLADEHLTGEQRQGKFEQPPRNSVKKSGVRGWKQADGASEFLDAYFAMTPEQKTAYLDEQIAE